MFFAVALGRVVIVAASHTVAGMTHRLGALVAGSVLQVPTKKIEKCKVKMDNIAYPMHSYPFTLCLEENV